MRNYDDQPRPRRTFRLMHGTMLMLALLLVSKLTAVIGGVHELGAIRAAQASSSAAKEEEKEEKKPDEGGHGGEQKEEGGHGEAEKPKEEMTHGTGKHSVKEIEALKEQGMGIPAYTKTEMDLLQNLSKRREQLDLREKDLALKSKVLEATEKRINSKVDEMKQLQAELTKVVAQYNEHQGSEIKSLVKIYENMKPADAAAIFNELDMPILLEVIDSMSERKVAPVLAVMDTKRARDVTQELAEMRRGRANVNRAAAAVPPAN